jgi:maleylacetate reductase
VNAFVLDALRLPRVVFGAGSLAQLEREVERLGARRVLVLCGPEQRRVAGSLALRLTHRCAGVYDRAAMHVPVEIAREASERARRSGVDVVLAIGGGSTTGLAKAVALETGLPILAIPTTYAGSEMTPIYGLSEGGHKRTGRDPAVLPRTVIYDPLLTLDLPAELSATSGLNAIAHAVEGLYARDANPLVSALAEDGLRALARALPGAVKSPHDLDARSQCLHGAWLCGLVLGAVGMALHHKLCHTLGGSFDLPHAPTHAVVLPHALAFNAAAAPQAAARVGRALGSDEPAAALHDLAASVGAPLSLALLGLRERDLDRAAELAVHSPYDNPRPVERAGIRALLADAFHGRRPRAWPVHS